MHEAIVSQKPSDLVDRWLEAEANGERFPVPFDMAWQIAGYSRKDSAKRYLPKSAQGEVYHVSVEKSGKQGGRPKETIYLSCDGLKHLCLMADTPEGYAIRQYFIEAEKKWKLVGKHFPSVASEVEIIQAKIELARLESQKAKTDLQILEFRNTIVNTCPEPIQQKILGYQVVEKTEYRDRIIANNQVINDGGTITKTELCHRYGIKTRNGKPDFNKLNLILKGLGIDPDSDQDIWQLSASIQESYQLKRDFLPQLDRLIMDSDRQICLGE